MQKQNLGFVLRDTYRHKGMRKKMVEAIRAMGFQDEAILQVMEKLPRHFFLDEAFDEWAYENMAFSIGYEQTISQPYTVAFQTSLLKLSRRMKVLEVGTGSGYQAAVLASLGARVYTIERQEGLFQKTTQLLREIGFPQIRCFLKDGYKGLPEYAPFDRILVTAAAPEIPSALLSQLTVGGILVIPVGTTQQEMTVVTRINESKYQYEKVGIFNFVPMLPGTQSA